MKSAAFLCRARCGHDQGLVLAQLAEPSGDVGGGVFQGWPGRFRHGRKGRPRQARQPVPPSRRVRNQNSPRKLPCGKASCRGRSRGSARGKASSGKPPACRRLRGREPAPGQRRGCNSPGCCWCGSSDALACWQRSARKPQSGNGRFPRSRHGSLAGRPSTCATLKTR